MSYTIQREYLTLKQVDDLVKYATEATRRAHHGPCCRAWTGSMINNDEERRAWDSDLYGKGWWQECDETQCTCGLAGLKNVLWDERIKLAYRDKKHFADHGASTTSTPQEQIDALTSELDLLRSIVIDAKKAQDKAEIERDKLQRKLDHIVNAAS